MAREHVGRQTDPRQAQPAKVIKQSRVDAVHGVNTCTSTRIGVTGRDENQPSRPQRNIRFRPQTRCAWKSFQILLYQPRARARGFGPPYYSGGATHPFRPPRPGEKNMPARIFHLCFFTAVSFMIAEVATTLLLFPAYLGRTLRGGDPFMASTTSFKQQCPSCEAMVPIRDPGLIGRKIDCPKCKYRFVVEKPKGKPKDDDEDEASSDTPAPSKKPKKANGVQPSSEARRRARRGSPERRTRSPRASRKQGPARAAATRTKKRRNVPERRRAAFPRRSSSAPAWAGWRWCC